MKVRHLLVPLVALGALAGCTTMPPAAASQTSAETAAETPTAPEPVTLAAGTVVATGALNSVDRMTTGNVTITADGVGQFDYSISNLVTPVTDVVNINLTVEPFTEAAYCDGGFPVFVMGQMELSPAMTIKDAHWDELTFGNPAFLDTLLLTSNNGATPKTGCFYPVIASATLDWTMPDLRPDLVVVDSGETGGAMGRVAQVDGEPASYEVVAGDVLDEIAARFGISVLDLFYLNPGRDKGQQPLAFSGELFNLLKSER